ncbi:hypothetical protein GCM10010423_35750 [Streptomyces levis]|uniref:Uncharacterized protein n=1 Tax=Streptomyces levis TaxID=285566 RepID=A0ABN3NTF0_9ACTN
MVSTASTPAPKAAFPAAERRGRGAFGRPAPDSADMESPLPVWGPLEDSGRWGTGRAQRTRSERSHPALIAENRWNLSSAPGWG